MTGKKPLQIVVTYLSFSSESQVTAQNNVNERVSSLVMTCRQRPRDRPSSIGLALHPYLLNTKDSGVFLVGCCTRD